MNRLSQVSQLSELVVQDFTAFEMKKNALHVQANLNERRMYKGDGN